MAKIEDTYFCDGCGTEISWSPVIKPSGMYCCQDCSDGLRCNCRVRVEFEDERRSDSALLDAGLES